MINSGTGNNVTNDDFLQVLLALKQNTMKATNVAEVCQVTGVTENKYSCKILSSGFDIECVSLKDLSVLEDDLVVVLFIDTDFRANARRIMDGKESQKIEQEVLHTRDCGIIIGVLYRNEQVEV